MSDIESIAKVIFADKFGQFTEVHSQFLADKDAVLEMDGLADFLDEESDEGDLLWAMAFTNQRIEWIDWSGEEHEEQLKQFVDHRFEALAGASLDWGFLDEFEAGIDLSKLRKGDYVSKKMRCINEALQKHGYVLGLLDRGDDQYHPFVAAKKDFESINGLESGYSTVAALSGD